MDLAKILEDLRHREGLGVTEFMRRVGRDRTTWYAWMRGEGPYDSSIQMLEDTYGVRFTRDRSGEITGHRKLSTDDIGDSDDDIHINETHDSGTLSETEMVEQYDAIARRMLLPRWEDLQDDVREDVKRELVYLENEMVAARRTTENKLKDLIKRHGH